MSNRLTLRGAQNRVAVLKSFYIHLTVFVLVMLLLAVINLTNGGPAWVLWPLAFWGLGLAVHAFIVFGPAGRLIQNWELRRIRTLTGRR